MASFSTKLARTMIQKFYKGRVSHWDHDNESPLVITSPSPVNLHAENWSYYPLIRKCPLQISLFVCPEAAYLVMVSRIIWPVANLAIYEKICLRILLSLPRLEPRYTLTSIRVGIRSRLGSICMGWRIRVGIQIGSVHT